MNAPHLTIEQITTLNESQQVERLMQNAWELSDLTVIPAAFIYTIAVSKGVVLLARDGAVPVGFCLSYPSFLGDDVTTGTLRHWSHMAAVDAAYRGQGIAAQIKLAQRKAVLAQGIGLMCWTFDPLETQNARLNIHKLGAISNSYTRNKYGDMNDALNAGLPTDRLRADWWLDSERVRRRVSGANDGVGIAPHKNARPLNEVAHRKQLLTPSELHPIDPNQVAHTLTVPADFQAIKRADNALALAWRMHTRAAFEGAFAADFAVTDLLRVADDRCVYVLTRKSV